MTKFRRAAAALGAGALALALTTGSTGTAQAADGPPSYIGGWLALNTSKTASGNSVQFVTVNADGTRTRNTAEAISADSGCALKTDTPNYVTFSSSSSLGAGFSAGAIGVRQKKNAAGTSCSAVDKAASETLTLVLGSIDSRVASAASLDVDLKQNAQILATARLGNVVVARFQLVSGSQAVPIPVPPLDGYPGLPAPTVYPCNLASDSGADSTTSNNCRWDISGPSWTPGVDNVNFTSLDLTALAGSFSLMGGADGKVTNQYPVPSYFLDSASDDTDASIFELVDGSLDCGFSAPIRNSTSSFKRLDDLGSTTCDPFPYSTRSGVDTNGPFVEIVKPVRSSTRAQGLWTTTFTVGGQQNDPPPPIGVTLDYFNTATNLPDVKPFDPLLLCPSEWGTVDAFVGPTTVSDVPYPYACLVSDPVRGRGNQKANVTYTAYVYGDARMQ